MLDENPARDAMCCCSYLNAHAPKRKVSDEMVTTYVLRYIVRSNRAHSC